MRRTGKSRILKYDPDSGAELRLIDGGLPMDSPDAGEIIQGQIIFGVDARTRRAVTILDAWLVSSSLVVAADDPNPQQTLRGHTVLLGRSHPDSEGRFESCSFSFGGLAEWVAPYFKLIESEFAESVDIIRVSHRASVEFDVADSHFHLFTGVSSHRGKTSLELEMKTAWIFRRAQPISLDDAWAHAIQPLKYLHVLLTSEATELRDLKLQLPKRADRIVADELDVYADWIPATSRERRRWSDAPVTAREIMERLPDRVSSWLRTIRDAEPGIVLLFSVLGQEKEFYLQTKFLTLAQAAEAYHRHHPAFASRVLDEAEHEERVSTVVAAAPDGHRPWLEEKLRHSNEPTFRQRIKEVREHVGPFGRDSINSRALTRIVDFRNELTHVLEPSIPDEDERFAEVNLAAGKLSLLMRGALLRDLGLEPDAIGPALRRSQHDAFLSDYKFPKR